jgi:hypothetical protein
MTVSPFCLLSLLFALSTPQALAAGDTPASPTVAAETQADPLTTRLSELVDRYFQALGRPPSSEERGAGVAALQSLLLAGIPLPSLDAAVTEAARLHDPGRPLPFELAVPLQVRQPAGTPEAAPAPEPELPAAEPKVARTEPEPTRSPTRNANYRLWKRKLAIKRNLVAAGIGVYSATTVIQFGAASGMVLGGATTSAAAWTTAIPVVGGLIFGIGTNQPPLVVLGVNQAASFGLLLAGALLPVEKVDDQQAGRPALRLALVPTGSGAALIGRF